MLRISHSSIQRKQVGIIMLTASVALLLACAGFVLREIVAFRNDMVARLSSMADIVARNCTAALDFNVPKDAQEVLASLGTQPYIVSACLYNKEGQVFATFHRPDMQTDSLPQHAPLPGHVFRRNHLALSRTVFLNQEPVGTLYLKSDLVNLTSRLKQYAFIAVGVLLAAQLGALLVSTRVQRVISGPILELARVARTVATEKSYSVRAAKHSDDELGQLIDGFNEMLSQIQIRDAALQEARENLEKRVEERTRELAESLSVLHATLESTADGILVVDQQGRVVSFNGKFVRMWGISDTVLLTKDDKQFLGFVLSQLKEPGAFLNRVQELYTHPSSESYDLVEFKDGRIFERYSQPQQIGGISVGRVWSFRDITERKRAEREKTEMEIQLQQAQKLESIGRLAAGIAHEINTPTQYIGDNVRFLHDAFTDLNNLLAAYGRLQSAAEQQCVTPALAAEVGALAQDLDVSYLTTEIPKAVRESLEGVERVARIVRSMKEFSHPGSTEKTAINLNQAIESTVTVARNEWKYVADLVLDLQPSLTPVLCLPGEFNQVILNLVINASHAIAEKVGDGSKEKGKITIQTRRDGEWVEVRVQDTGAGIPQAIQNRMFEPFFTTKPVGKGTGQGLAIARSVIVDKHGGTITFESTEGLGTTFIIRLPINPTIAGKQRMAA